MNKYGKVMLLIAAILILLMSGWLFLSDHLARQWGYAPPDCEAYWGAPGWQACTWGELERARATQLEWRESLTESECYDYKKRRLSTKAFPNLICDKL